MTSKRNLFVLLELIVIALVFVAAFSKPRPLSSTQAWQKWGKSSAMQTTERARVSLNR